MPMVIWLAIVIVLVLIVVQLVPLVDRCIAKLLPVRVIRTQQFGGVCEVEEVLVVEPPVVVRRMALMLLLPEPRRITIANREPVAVDSRIITPPQDAVVVPLWLVRRAVIEPSPLKA
jgi:hypothetical protein